MAKYTLGAVCPTIPQAYQPDEAPPDELVECQLIYPGGPTKHRLCQMVGVTRHVLVRRAILDDLDAARARTLDISDALAGVVLPPQAVPDPDPPPKERIPHRLRIAIFERDAYRCQRCGDWHNLCVDHRHPESLGGTLDPANLQTLCRTCNVRKGATVEGAPDA